MEHQYNVIEVKLLQFMNESNLAPLWYDIAFHSERSSRVHGIDPLIFILDSDSSYFTDV